ncbi:hypothetical protein A1O3_04326 [Capronia epimyces CBS 606.96]|uniref:Zn(2)-C6 fungal-type domain-containing protein n=1 Tax=Capronia epimyces CBS 606.96 TaxID=1182542 RepID=W9Y3K5_9EURO|nr:uncharacterized protein A1O3_04326 [Capronia epimyces CBS 606.96]EXJ87367.1 hypothetical protein A1O3_04326 [Capronia epimyces CBS 606.96]
MDTPPVKRGSPPSVERGTPSKRIKTLPEEPTQYSDAVRKKLAATSRTGQACDRCKERKMKCDIDPMACQPCRQKGLRCYTTDRVTGQARERGETSRAENELHFLREQLAAYQHRYGPLQRPDTKDPVPATIKEPPPVIGPYPTVSVPDARYVGWPAPDHSEPLESGPVKGTVVDIMDGTVDISAWDCEMMRDYPPTTRNRFNLSRTSITNTIAGYQRVEDPKLPPREEALRDASHFLVIMSQYVPVVHRPSFLELVRDFYARPTMLTAAERVQVVMVFAIIAHQTAVRNHYHSTEKFEDSHRYLHYALGSYRDLWHDRSLASMQAMALIIVHFRNLPKPGVSWTYSHKVLVRAIELEYHRDPDKIDLPEGERDLLSKELRKRVFHSILGICVTTGCRVGSPAPWQFQHIDLPLPRPLKDSELSKEGVSSDLSGHCDFWPCLHLAKLLPLLTELHNNIISVRRPAATYLRTVNALNTKINAWKLDWDESIKNEPKHVNITVATLLIETWAAEYQLNLYHPACCTSDDPEVMDRHLDMSHKSAKRLLQNFHILSSKYKGVDFTWHSTLAYATGFGITLYTYRRRKTLLTMEQYEAMRNELKGWISLMAYADLVLSKSISERWKKLHFNNTHVGTGNHLVRLFQPRVRALEEEYRRVMVDAAPKPPNSIQPPSFVPVNGPGIPLRHKLELLNQAPSLEAETLRRKHTLPHPVFIHSQVRPQSQPQSPSNQSSSLQPWPLSIPFLAQPQSLNLGHPAAANPSSPIYPAFGQSPAGGLATLASPIQSIPTSLASLLNNSGGLYVNYPSPSQTQDSLGVGGGGGGGDDPVMSFSPNNHYLDGPGPTVWPLITMPPGQQSSN